MYDFLVHGLPRKVVADNSPTFSSEERFNEYKKHVSHKWLTMSLLSG